MRKALKIIAIQISKSEFLRKIQTDSSNKAFYKWTECLLPKYFQLATKFKLEIHIKKRVYKT